MRLFDLISTNFENFDETVKTYLQKSLRSLGIEYSSSNIFGLILNVIKGVMQNAMFYIEDAFTEQNIYTAKRKKSIYNLAKISGYSPYYGTSATGTINVSSIAGQTVQLTGGNTSISTKLYIKDKTQVRNNTSGIVYTIMLPVDEYIIDISKPLVQHEFKIVEGVMSYASFTASGKAFETFSVGVNGLWDRNYMYVYVNNELWSEVSSIYDLSQYQKGYTITPGFESLFAITFGNDIYGYQLKRGDTIVVQFLTHNGSSGNTSSDNFVFESTIFNSKGTAVNPNEYLLVNISNKVTGGTNADSIDTVKEAIGKDTQTNTYVTSENYELFLSRFSFVGWCSVFADSSNLLITGCCLRGLSSTSTSVDYFNIKAKNLYLTDHEKEIITDTLENSNKAFAGINFELIDPIIRQYSVIVYVKLEDSTTSRDTVTEKIRNTFAEYFMALNRSTKYIAKSALINKLITDIPDTFVSIEFDFISDEAESAFYNGYYTEYEYKNENGSGKYVKINKNYEKDSTPGLDTFGNIELTSDLEFPLLTSGFKYYPDKSSKTDSIVIQDAVMVYYF
jgi:hypothetical protein